MSRIIKSIIRRFKAAVFLSADFPIGSRFPILYRVRKFLSPNKIIPVFIVSPHKVFHYLSSDPLDEHVLKEILGTLSPLFFPSISENVRKELENGGFVLDIGAFNGAWGSEMLARFPNANGIFFEPNPEKCFNINRTINRSNLTSKSILIDAGIAKSTGHAWLVKSEDGAWGDWLEYTKPQDESIKVKTITLMDALGTINPVVVKCNAEGGEFEFIDQLIELKLKPKIIILMVHVEMGNTELLFNKLINVGYNINIAKDHPRRPIWHLNFKKVEPNED